MRLVLLALAALSAGCFLRPLLHSAGAPECERACDEIAAQCWDDSAARDQPDRTTCREDPALCLAQCTVIESISGVGIPVR
jgi:hypothetical protein